MLKDANGREYFQVVDRVELDENGFKASAALIGSEHKAIAATMAERNRDELEQIATGTDSKEAAEAARKAKRRVFADINPHADVEQHKPVDYLPKRGTALDVLTPEIVTKPLTHVEAAKQLRDRLGRLWKGAEHFTWLQQNHPDGVPSEALNDIEADLRADDKRSQTGPLRVVGGA